MAGNSFNRKFLIATHGAFAQGIKTSLDIIIGTDFPVFLIQAYLDGNSSIEPELIQLFQHMEPTDEWVIFTDLLGGSVNNQVLRYALMERVHVVSGFNLPLLIEVILSDNATPAGEVIENALRNAKDQMVYVNQLLTVKDNQSEHDQINAD
jgi:fructoselysine/glucoselysine PTS system EIIA component